MMQRELRPDWLVCRGGCRPGCVRKIALKKGTTLKQLRRRIGERRTGTCDLRHRRRENSCFCWRHAGTHAYSRSNVYSKFDTLVLLTPSPQSPIICSMRPGPQPCDRRGSSPLQTDKNPRFPQISPVTPLLATHPKFHARNPFLCHTCKNKGLKVLYLPHIQNPGVKKLILPTYRHLRPFHHAATRAIFRQPNHTRRSCYDLHCAAYLPRGPRC